MRRWFWAVVFMVGGLDACAHAGAPQPTIREAQVPAAAETPAPTETPEPDAEKPAADAGAREPAVAWPDYFVADGPGGPTVVLTQQWASPSGEPQLRLDAAKGTPADVAPYFAAGARTLGRDPAHQGYLVEVPGSLDAATEALVGQRLEVFGVTGQRCVVEVTRVARQRFYSMRDPDQDLARDATEAQILAATESSVALRTSAYVKPIGRCPAVGIAGPTGVIRLYQPSRMSDRDRKALIAALHATPRWQWTQEDYSTDRADIVAACPRAARSLPGQFDDEGGGLDIRVFAATNAPRIAWIWHAGGPNGDDDGFRFQTTLVEREQGWTQAHGVGGAGLASVAGEPVAFGPAQTWPDQRSFWTHHVARQDGYWQDWGPTLESEGEGFTGHCNYTGTVSYRAAMLIERFCPNSGR